MNTSLTAVAEQGSKASRAAASRLQAKLSVSRSNDTYEQEADRIASVVVGEGAVPAGPAAAAGVGAQRMPAAAAVATKVVPKISRLAHRAPQRRVQRQTEEEEEAQAKIQRQEEEEPQAKVQRQEEEEEAQAKVQRQEEEESQAKLQRQEEKEEAQAKVQLQEEEEPQAKLQRQEEKEEAQAKVQRQEEEKPQAKVQRQEEEPQAKLQRQEEEEPQAKLQCQEEKEEAQAKVQRQEEEEPQAKLQRQEEEETQAKVQRQEEEETQTKVQRQEEENEPQAKIQRQEEEEAQAKVQRKAKGEQEEPEKELGEKDIGPEREGQEERKEELRTKSEARANVRDKRQFPVLDRVEGKLFENKGKGEPLEEETGISMETSFRADFGGVRIHTGGDAVDMSRELGAQAFTHGKDVFFNSGKYEPETVRGRRLLAHELTHVVQQGAAEQKVAEGKIEQNNAKKNEAPPEPTDKKAVTVEERTKEELKESELKLGEKAKEGALGAAGEAAPKPAEAKEAPKEEESKPAEGVAVAKEGEAEAEVKGAAKAKAKGKKAVKKIAAKAAGGAGAVGDFLRRMTKATFESKKANVSKLAANEKTKEPAETKLAQTEKSVVPPVEEGASRAKAGQVEAVEKAKEPEPDEAEAKEKFNTALDNAVPSTLEEVDKFKEEGKGRVVGQAVKGVVTADAQEVKGTYQEIDNPPAPAPPEREPEELPEVEAAPETAPIDMGDGVVGEVQPEQTDLSEFDQESDNLLEKEGMKEEHLEMVDEGDLAEAKKDRKQVKTTAKEGPREVKLFEQQQKQKVSKDLRKEEQEGRQKMKEERQKELLGAKDDQKKTKSKIEQKREAVTARINAIYEKANSTVKQKLEDLEKKSLKDFDEGEKKATKTFEDNVKRRIDAFKRRRYDRFGGSLLWAKDKLFGMDDLPEVKSIFDSEKSRFITSIDALIKKITAENKRVIQECKDIVAAARAEIETFVQSLGPELRQTGQDALKEMSGKLDALDKKINAKEKELQKKLAEKREAAIKAIEEKIEKMKEEMSGLLSKLGNLLLNAMLKFFKWALKKAGYASDQLMGILNKGKAVIKKIVTDPIGFIGNIIKAVKDGIDLFVTNIKKHLISGLISWLTGAMADVPITLPTKWDLKGILHLILQILGLTWDRIRRKLVKRLGEKVVRIAETTVDILKRLITEGPMALWEMIKAKAAAIKQQVMEGIRNWVITQVVKQAIIKLISFLNPAGAIIQAILAIYNTVMFFVENWDRIVQFVKTVFSSIADIAMGKLSAAAQAVERAMAMTIPIILNFLARLIGLSGIGKAVSKIIKKIRKPIDKIVDKVIASVAKMAKKLLKKVKAGAKALKEKGLALIKWWTKKRSFKDKSGQGHQLFFKGNKKSAKLMVASNNSRVVLPFIQDKKKEAKSTRNDTLLVDANLALSCYKSDVGPVEKKLRQADIGKAAAKQDRAINENKKLVDELERGLAKLAPKLANLLTKEDEYPPPKLPVMADNKKASSFVADYIVKKGGKYQYGVKTGTESGAHVGNLEGWPQLQGAKLTKGSKWVRMHLLPHRLGGNAVDSNLTPARGPRSNVPFSHAVEKPAIQKAIINPAQSREPIWYKFQISYHGGKHKAFPKFLRAEFGGYQKAGGQWKRGPTVKGFSQSPAIPEFVPTTPNLNDPNLFGAQIKAASGVDLGFATLLLNVRAGKGGSFGTKIGDFEMAMDKRYVGRDATGKKYYRFGVQDYPQRLGKVLTALRKGKLVLN